MAEYGRKQREQLSRTIVNSEARSIQLMSFVDNRNQVQCCKNSPSIGEVVQRGKTHHDKSKDKRVSKRERELAAPRSKRARELMAQGIPKDQANKQAKREIKKV